MSTVPRPVAGAFWWLPLLHAHVLAAGLVGALLSDVVVQDEGDVTGTPDGGR